jgi:probable F420-dependent oxidoreductase
MPPTRRPIRIAAQLHPQHGAYRDMRAAILRAEELGYDIGYTWDHFFPLYGDPSGAHHECWTLLAAWAEATERIELGPLVSSTSYRNPDLLADMARTLDHVAGGRTILGLGAGWFQRDYAAYGYEFGSAGTRLAGLATALPRIRARLDVLNPAPIRRPPILIGGTGLRRTLRLVAEHADAWHAGFPERPAELESAVAALRDWSTAIGRDPADIEWGVGVEPDDLDRFLADDALTYVEMGFSQFTLGFNGPNWAVDRGRPWLSWRDAMNAETLYRASASQPAASAAR